jgi:hypothetical protein
MIAARLSTMVATREPAAKKPAEPELVEHPTSQRPPREHAASPSVRGLLHEGCHLGPTIPLVPKRTAAFLANQAAFPKDCAKFPS